MKPKGHINGPSGTKKPSISQLILDGANRVSSSLCSTSGLIWYFCKVNENICPAAPVRVFQVGLIYVSVLIITHSLALCVDVDYRGFHSSWPAIDTLPLIRVQLRDGKARWRQTENTHRAAVFQSLAPSFSLTQFHSLFDFVTFSYLLN